MIIARVLLAGIFLVILGLATMATFGLLGHGEIEADANRLQSALTRAKANSLVAANATEQVSLTVTGATWSADSTPFAGAAAGNEPLGYAANSTTVTPVVGTLTLTYANGRFMGAVIGSQSILTCDTPPPSGTPYNALTLYLSTVRVAVSC